MQAARSGKLGEAVLQFHTPEKQWEYLFIPQEDDGIDGKQKRILLPQVETP